MAKTAIYYFSIENSLTNMSSIMLIKTHKLVSSDNLTYNDRFIIIRNIRFDP